MPIENYDNVDDKSFLTACDIRRNNLKISIIETDVRTLLLKFYKPNKKEVIYSYPISNQITINSIFERVLSGMNFLNGLVITPDFKFFIGFDECKALYRFIYKGYALHTKDAILRWKDIPESYRESILNCEVYIEMYKGITAHELNNIWFNSKAALIKED